MPNLSTSGFFDSYAQDFNAIYGNKNNLLNNLINKLFRKTMKIRFSKTVEGCFPIDGKNVIDIGCGPGHYSITLAQKGASHILGIDFAEGMINHAKKNAEHAGALSTCDFVLGDFSTYDFRNRFDYSIIMGFMDYIEKPKEVIEKVLSITKSKAFFSFPSDRGFLAWQRKLRYKRKCRLFMYNVEQLHELFKDLDYKEIKVEKLDRDYFVTVFM